MNVQFRLPRLAIIAVAALLSRQALAQNTTSGGGASAGDFPVTFSTAQTQFANLSTYDCLNSSAIDFSYVYPWVSAQQVEYVLSLTSTCTTPDGAPFAGPSSCSTLSSGACPSMLMNQGTATRPQPTTDGKTTDFSGTSPTNSLTSAGLWDFYTKQSASMTSTNSYSASPSPANCGPAGGIGNTLIYLCVLMSPAATTGAAIPVGSLSIALASSPPAAPAAPTVQPLDSGLRVTWGAVTNAAWYNVYVQVASTTDGGADDAGASDAGASDGGTPQYAGFKQVNNVTTADITGLTNGVAYNVFVQALDDSGTAPPTSSNISDPSPTATGTPVPSFSYFQNYKNDGGNENGGCSNLGVPSLLALLVTAFALRRRRQRSGVIGAGVLLIALSSFAGVARAEDAPKDSDTDTSSVDTPPVRKPSPEWFRVEAMTGPFYPNPDKGITGAPFAKVFPAKNQLLWRVQMHVNIFSLFGHLSVGVGVGIWQTNGHALLSNGTAAADPEAFTLYPISGLLGYRADFIYTKWKVPIVPYGKVGWGFVPWTDTKNGKITKGTTGGRSWISEGWANGLEWAAGIEFPLDFLDQQRAANMDEDFGINSVGIFGEFSWQYWKGMNGGLPLDGWSGSGGLYVAF